MALFDLPSHQKMYTCGSCGLYDPLVDCAGIYYCPNPFCYASGATNWKMKNLNLNVKPDGITFVDYAGWLDKGMAVVDAMPHELRAKILALPTSLAIIKELRADQKWSELLELRRNDGEKRI